MSLFPPALAFVLDNEDYRRQYDAVPDAPPGARAISGINSAAYPDWFAKISVYPASERSGYVAQFYQTEFWNPLQIQGIADQATANRVLDQSVNGGPRSGPTLLQISANACGASLVVDGSIGPNTLKVVNSLDPAKLLSAYKTARINHYTAIARNNPQDAQYLAEWLARASK